VWCAGVENSVLQVYYVLPIQMQILLAACLKLLERCPLAQDIFRCCRGCDGIGGRTIFPTAQGFCFDSFAP
jgi:hypothetical protein